MDILQNLVEFCKSVRDAFPEKIIIAGNVVTREVVEELIINGKVDVVKVGIGPGSVCTTRIQTGSWNAAGVCNFGNVLMQHMA